MFYHVKDLQYNASVSAPDPSLTHIHISEPTIL